MKNLFYILLLLLLPIIGCDKKIGVELPPHEPKLVVNCFFEEGNYWKVYLSSSSGINDNNIQKIGNATVGIYKNGELLEILEHIGEGIYTGSTFPLHGNSYMLKASAPGYELVTASDTLPGKIDMKDVSLRYIPGAGIGMQDLSELGLKFFDPPGPDFYSLNLEVSQFNDSTRIIWYTSIDPSFDVPEGSNLTFTDKYFNGREYHLVVQSHEIVTPWQQDSGDSLGIKLISLSVDSYNYGKSILLQKSVNDPLSKNVQVSSNIEGGYGIFGGRAISEVRVALK